MTSPRKPTAGFWITVALVALLVGYPLSFGPACWVTSYFEHSGAVPKIYRPFVLTFGNPDPEMQGAGKVPAIARILQTYSSMAARQDWCWVHSVDDSGQWSWEWAKTYRGTGAGGTFF